MSSFSTINLILLNKKSYNETKKIIFLIELNRNIVNEVETKTNLHQVFYK